MSAAEVLGQARALGIALKVSGGKLHYEAPVGRMTPELRATLAANKAAILDVLNAAPMTATEERAIRAWLVHIGETDAETIACVMDQCWRDPEAREYFIRRAEELPQVRRVLPGRGPREKN